MPIGLFAPAFATLLLLLTGCASTADTGPPLDFASLDKGTYTTSEVEAPGPVGPLAGTLTLPEGSGYPAALILPGSGPTDRDGNGPLGLSASSYKLLAEELGSYGIATLRADKRGMFASASAVTDPNDVTIADYVGDVRSWRDVVMKRTGADCVWLIGHSEGGLVAMAAAEEEHICGLVLLATAGRKPADVIREQLRSNPANAVVLDEAMAAMDRLEKGEHVDTSGMNPALLPLFNEAVQDFVIDLFRQDPAAMVGKYDGPVLVVQGMNDIQVSVADAEALGEAQPRADVVLVPGVTHTLKTMEGEGMAANIATYSDASKPLSPGVVAPIVVFIRSRD